MNRAAAARYPCVPLVAHGKQPPVRGGAPNYSRSVKRKVGQRRLGLGNHHQASGWVSCRAPTRSPPTFPAPLPPKASKNCPSPSPKPPARARCRAPIATPSTACSSPRRSHATSCSSPTNPPSTATPFAAFGEARLARLACPYAGGRRSPCQRGHCEPDDFSRRARAWRRRPHPPVRSSAPPTPGRR